MRKFFTFCFIAFILVIAITSCNPNITNGGGGDIVVAAKDFTEQDILGELLAQQIEAKTNLKVLTSITVRWFFCLPSSDSCGQN